MKIRATLLLFGFSLLAACGSSGEVSQKHLEDLLTEARVDAATKQYWQAEQKLRQCLDHADKQTHQKWIALSALNQLTDLEKQRHNDARAKAYMNEASRIAETVCNSNQAKLLQAEPRLLKEAIKALLIAGDEFSEMGRYDAAKRLYCEAKKLERADLGIRPEDCAQSRLQRLDQHIDRERHAIEREDGLKDDSDPKYLARLKRTEARRKLMREMKRLTNQMNKEPKPELVDEMLPLVESIRTAFGERETEYRAALTNCVAFASTHGRSEKALELLNRDIALYDDIDRNKLLSADTTMLENANFLISDLAQYTNLMRLKNNFEETRKAALRGIELAEEIRQRDSQELAALLMAAAWEREQRNRFEEAIPFRKRQIAMLARIGLNDDYPDYYEARLRLGQDLLATERAAEALPELQYAIERFQAKHIHGEGLAYAYTLKSECLCKQSKYAEAHKCIIDAQKIWEAAGNDEQKFDCCRAFSKVSRALGRYDEAYKMNIKALQYADRIPAKKRRSELPQVYNEITHLEIERHHFKEAELFGRKALEAQLKISEKSGFGNAAMLNTIALAVAKQGNFAEAERLHLRAIQYCKESKETPRTPELSSLLQLANLYDSTNQKEKAEKAYRNVLKLAQSLRGPEEMKDQYAIHFVRMCRIQLANLLKNKNPADAEKLKNETLTSMVSLRTADPAMECNFLTALADLCMNLQDHQNAEKILNEDQNVANSTNPPLKDWLIQTYIRKRDLYAAMKKEDSMREAAVHLARLKNSPGAR